MRTIEGKRHALRNKQCAPLVWGVWVVCPREKARVGDGDDDDAARPWPAQSRTYTYTYTHTLLMSSLTLKHHVRSDVGDLSFTASLSRRYYRLSRVRQRRMIDSIALFPAVWTWTLDLMAALIKTNDHEEHIGISSPS
ncbi:hypothetical protein BP00DRAFT_242894 [Aspergillus indologenus CBS 114.80]|uniref:Uncharacterized protein n=1 Tax=Aspergillus indologenus CBS 114.80 TaxID=1450541 RepID=A0A2V5IL88_9EURO|nr:hypothetical protein BP00DRAFT_242894 [Aspergillus indologenus CBS 114.80]